MNIATLILSSTLASVPPDVPLPDALDVCILTAEICVLKPQAEECAPVDEKQQQFCISEYETCTYDIPEAHDPACRLDYVWCLLELSDASPKSYHAHCAEVFDTCPT